MTGPEHYRAAEEQLIRSSKLAKAGWTTEHVLVNLAYAHVHAILASKAATALARVNEMDGAIRRRQGSGRWSSSLVQLARAEPPPSPSQG